MIRKQSPSFAQRANRRRRDVRLKDGENVYLEETDEASNGSDGGMPLLWEDPEAAGLGAACPQNAPGQAFPAFRVYSRRGETQGGGRARSAQGHGESGPSAGDRGSRDGWSPRGSSSATAMAIMFSSRSEMTEKGRECVSLCLIS